MFLRLVLAYCSESQLKPICQCALHSRSYRKLFVGLSLRAQCWGCEQFMSISPLKYTMYSKLEATRGFNMSKGKTEVVQLVLVNQCPTTNLVKYCVSVFENFSLDLCVTMETRRQLVKGTTPVRC